MSDELAIGTMNDSLTGKAGDVYCSIQAGSMAEKALIYNAMNNPAHRLGDCINKTLIIRDVLAEMISITDDVTGEVSQAPRIVLIDKDGESYQAVSKGIFNAVKKAIVVFGPPTWEVGLPIVVKQVSFGKNQMLTFDIAAL